jgi:flavodoxin
MKTLVTYFSQTGNTKRVAEAIYDAITGDKTLQEMKDTQTLEGYDLSFIGFPIHGFGAANQATTFLAEKAGGKKVALFITHGAAEESDDLILWIEACKKAASNAEVVATFNCQGEIAPEIIDMLKSSDDPKLRSFAEMGSHAKGQPDESRLNKAREFARKTAP